MDEKVKLLTQMEANIAPVILINKFNVKPEDVDQFLRTWAADAAIMKRQPGFISTQLHRGIAGSCVFINAIMQFGSLPNIISVPLTILSFNPVWGNIQEAL